MKNKAISRVRSLGERLDAEIKRVLNGGRVMVTPVGRANVKNLF